VDGRWCLVEAAQLVAVGDLHELLHVQGMLESLVGGGGIDKIMLIYAIHSHGPLAAAQGPPPRLRLGCIGPDEEGPDFRHGLS